MRILYFSREYTSHDHRFLKGWSDAGEKVYYLTLERRGQPLEDRVLPPNVEIVNWKGGRGKVSLSQAPGFLWDLKRVLRQVKPDIFQAGPLQTAGLLAALSGFHPLVSMSWGYDLLIDAGRSPRWERATRYTLSHSDAMVGDCATIRRKAVEYGMAPDRIVTFPWGVDIRHFSPAEEGYSNQDQEAPFTLLSTRGWEPIYGTDILVKAFVRAARSIPGLNLMLLGNGSLASRLRRTIEDGGVADRVVFPGQVRYHDLPRYYHKADLYVSASHSDGSSISLLEAMACGTPALVSDIPGNQEWVEDGANGWLFPDGDEHRLADAILKAVEQRIKLPEMGSAARKVAEERADWSQNFPKVYEAFQVARK